MNRLLILLFGLCIASPALSTELTAMPPRLDINEVLMAKPKSLDLDLSAIKATELEAIKRAQQMDIQKIQEHSEAIKPSKPLPQSKPQASAEPEPVKREMVRNYTIFISESMDLEILKLLFYAYAGDEHVQFVLRGFRGDGTIEEGLKHIMDIVRQCNPPPNLFIDPNLFKKHGIDRVPAMLVEEITIEEDDIEALSLQLYTDVLAMYSTEIDINTAEEFLRANSSLTLKKEIVPRMLVFGVISTQWADQKLQTTDETFYQGTYGVNYRIVEPDLIEVMKARAAAIDWEHKKEQAADQYWGNAAKTFLNLPRAHTYEERLVDPSVVLTRSVKDGFGKVLFEKGTVVNPFDYTSFTREVVVFDGSDNSQLEVVDSLVEQARSHKNSSLVLLTTQIDPAKGWDQLKELSGRFNEPIFLLTPELQKRFQIRSVPSVVTGDSSKKVFLIREYLVTKHDF